MPEASVRAAGTTRLPLMIYVLAAGVFLMGTTEFIVAGILPEIADSIGVGVADAGLMITVFAVGMIIGTPLMAIATSSCSAGSRSPSPWSYSPLATSSSR
jgi:predicted MFS family arabinose efflux permease